MIINYLKLRLKGNNTCSCISLKLQEHMITTILLCDEDEKTTTLIAC